MCRAQGNSYTKVMKTKPATRMAEQLAVGKARPNAPTTYSEPAQRLALGKVVSPTKLGAATPPAPPAPPATADRGADSAAEATFGRTRSLLGAMVGNLGKLGG